MEFSEFAQLIYKYLGTKKDFPVFIDYLLSLFGVDDHDEHSPFFMMDTSTKSAYYRGSKCISVKNAGFVLNTFNKNHFLDAVESLSLDSKTALLADLRDKNCARSDAEFTETGDICADLFEKIIRDLSTYKKGSAKKQNAGQENPALFSLVLQSKNICPLCKKNRLYIQTGTQRIMYAKTAVIDDGQRSGNFANCIALCVSCADKMALEDNNTRMQMLKPLKEYLEKQETIAEAASKSDLEQDITDIVKAIADTNPASVQISYKPVELADKFTGEDFLLLEEVKDKATRYYGFIKELFCRKENFNFDKYCANIRTAFLEMEDKKMTKQAIFDGLTERFIQLTHKERIPCSIIVCFFIQNCEVFRALSE